MHTLKVKAKKLMQDDRFRMGGQLYRIADINRIMSGDGKFYHIKFYPISPLAKETVLNYMVVAGNTRFKIYNQ